jgi:hypothetical protein
MLESVLKYEAGQVYEFPKDVALRWIANGWARETKKKEPVKESS